MNQSISRRSIICRECRNTKHREQRAESCRECTEWWYRECWRRVFSGTLKGGVGGPRKTGLAPRWLTHPARRQSSPSPIHNLPLQTTSSPPITSLSLQRKPISTLSELTSQCSGTHCGNPAAPWPPSPPPLADSLR